MVLRGRSENRTKYVVAGIALAAAVAGMVAQLLATVYTRDYQALLSSRDMQLDEFRNEIETLQKRIASTQQKVAGVRVSPLPPDGVSSALAELRESSAAIEKRLGALEAAIASDPAKALSVPMLRRDVDDLREVYRRDIDAIRSELGRNATQSNWVLGLIGASVLTLAVNTFLNIRKESPTAERKP